MINSFMHKKINLSQKDYFKYNIKKIFLEKLECKIITIMIYMDSTPKCDIMNNSCRIPVLFFSF